MNDTTQHRQKKHDISWLLLIIVVLLSVLFAYRVQPFVFIDVGDYYDSMLLDHFHAREVDTASEGTTWQWDATAHQLTVPGKRTGVWIVTLHVADTHPDGAFKGLAMSANGVRLTIPRQSERLMVGVISADIAAADEITLQLEPGLREGPTPPAGLVGQVDVQPARTYRWSRDESRVLLPGIGRGAWFLAMTLVTAHPNQQENPTSAHISINDMPLATLPDAAALRRVQLLIPPSYVPSGDMLITLHANVYHDPRPLGVFVADMALSPTQEPPPMLPPLNTTGCILIIILALHTSISRLLQYETPLIRTPMLIGSSAIPLILLVWALTTHRMVITHMLPGVTLLCVWCLLLVLLFQTLFTHLLRSDSDETTVSIYNINHNVNRVLLVFLVSYLVKAVGMLYPYFIGIDVHWHMDRVRWILQGDLPLLYGTNSPLNESTMPLAEWGNDKPVIPYSPYYHIIAASFALLPWSLEMSANMVSVLLDSLHIPLIALLVYCSGLRPRVALLAVLLYALIPAKYLLHSWGNVPTTMGMWWAFAATTGIVLLWQRLRQPRSFVVVLLLLVAAFLVYTVAGFFTGVFLMLFTVIISAMWFVYRKHHETAHQHYRALLIGGVQSLWIITAVATILVLLIYYGQYISPILERTLPYFTKSFGSSAESMGKETTTVSDYLLRHTRLLYYGLALPLVTSVVWVVIEGRNIVDTHTVSNTPSSAPMNRVVTRHVLWAAISAWLLLTLLFVPLAYKISMVDKHFFVSIPCMALATAALLDRVWERFVVVRGLTLLWYVYLAVSSMQVWLMRIATVKQ